MKSVDIIFYITFNFCQNFKNYHGIKLNKTYLNMFSIPSRTVSRYLNFYFWLKIQKPEDTFIALHSFGKRFYVTFFYVSMPYFVVWILWPELRIFSQGVWFLNKSENINHQLR